MIFNPVISSGGGNSEFSIVNSSAIVFPQTAAAGQLVVSEKTTILDTPYVLASYKEADVPYPNVNIPVSSSEIELPTSASIQPRVDIIPRYYYFIMPDRNVTIS